MTLRFSDRAIETATTTGTGDFTLAGALTGYIRFSAIPSIATNDTVYYTIVAVDSGGTPTGDWETGLGTYSAANTLTRTTVSQSSNSNAAVSFSAGTKYVFASVNAAPLGAAIKQDVKGSDIASATTCDIGAATGGFVHITGTTTITGLGTIAAGTQRHVTFDGALTLTHNATSLILPGAANITTAAGDTAIFRSEGSGNWRCITYTKASGSAIVGGVGWTLAGSWTWSTNVATVDFTGLGSYSDFLVIMRNVTTSSVAFRMVLASVNNGSTFYSSVGDYVNISSLGTESNEAFLAYQNTSTTSARGFYAHIPGANVNGAPKACMHTGSPTGTLLVASTSPINALRVGTSAGNMTAGSIYVFAR